MRIRPPFVLLCTVASFLAAGFGCSLDFDRYDATDGSADAAPDGSSGGDARRGGTDTGVPVVDAPAGCAPASCLTQASSCAATCTQKYQQCTSRCQNMGCMQNCTAQKQSCGGQCATACIDCAQNASCSPTNDCLAAGSPP